MPGPARARASIVSVSTSSQITYSHSSVCSGRHSKAPGTTRIALSVTSIHFSSIGTSREESQIAARHRRPPLGPSGPSSRSRTRDSRRTRNTSAESLATFGSVLVARTLESVERCAENIPPPPAKRIRDGIRECRLARGRTPIKADTNRMGESHAHHAVGQGVNHTRGGHHVNRGYSGFRRICERPADWLSRSHPAASGAAA
jgi:hypothetical protein